MPRHPKPKELRQNTERQDVGDVPGEGSEQLALIEIPPARRTWLHSTKASWKRYWSSPARFATVASLDMDTLERLWTLYDERTRAQIELAKARVVAGSTGQMRPSPFYVVIAKLDAEIRQLEDRVAKHMRARLTLGMVVGRDDAGRDELEPSRTPGNDADDGYPTEDPRLYVLDRHAG